MAHPEPLLTAEEAAQFLNISRNQVYIWARAGFLPSVRFSRRVLRFRRSELEFWLEAHARPAVAQ